MIGFPILKTIQTYNWNLFQQDSKAGITTAIMLVPQAMAYAMLAGLEPIVGLYASTIPTLIYAFLGTSRQLAVGPVAMDSILVALAVTPLAGDNPILYTQYATLLMLMVGVCQLLIGFLKLGRFANRLSEPVLSGFTSAAAVIIAFAQLKHLLGMNIPRNPYFHQNVLYVFEHIRDIQFTPFAIGFLGMLVLIGLKAYNSKFPRHLLVIIAGAMAVYFIEAAQNTAIVGHVPQGLPSFVVPTFDMHIIGSLVVSAFMISFIAFMEAFSVGKRLAQQDQYEIEANQEILALGSANFVGAFFQGYAVTGGFSRSSVNYDAGAKTTISGMITALVVVFVLLFLTKTLFFIPKTILAAIIMTAVAGLFDSQSMKKYFVEDKNAFGILISTFLITLFVGVQTGIVAGIAIQILVDIFGTQNTEDMKDEESNVTMKKLG